MSRILVASAAYVKAYGKDMVLSFLDVLVSWMIVAPFMMWEHITDNRSRYVVPLPVHWLVSLPCAILLGIGTYLLLPADWRLVTFGMVYMVMPISGAVDDWIIRKREKKSLYRIIDALSEIPFFICLAIILRWIFG